MRSDAQRKSDSKYQKKSSRIVLKYSEKETEDYQEAKALGTSRIKTLVKEEVRRQNGQQGEEQ